MLAAPNWIYPNTIDAIRATTLHVTRQNTISISTLFTAMELNLLTYLLAKNDKTPPTRKVYKKNNRATYPAI